MLFFFFLACTTPEEATTACSGSCDHQLEGCSDLNLEECYGLCDWVVATIEDEPKCLGLGVKSWECDQSIDWECDPEYDMVGSPLDSSQCEEHSQAFEDAGCKQSE